MSMSDEVTTETDDIAMQKPAAAGGSCSCQIGKKRPAATGIPSVL